MKKKAGIRSSTAGTLKGLRIYLVIILFFVEACLLMPSTDAFAATATWNGGVGLWSVNGNWGLNPAPGAPPYFPTQSPPLYDVTIGGSGSIVNYDRVTNTGAIIGTLNIGSGNKLVISPTSAEMYLTVTGGTITNNGTIELAALPAGQAASLKIGANTLLSGTGVIAMSNSSYNYIGADNSSNNYKLTIDTGQTMRGSGQIGPGSNAINIENRGRITANQPIGLAISATYGSGTAGMVNTGILEAVSGGTLELKMLRPLMNTGGTIQAMNGSLVLLNGGNSAETHIIGGTLKTEGTGVIRAVGSTTNSTTAYNLIKDVTLTSGSKLEVATGAILKLQGTITNDGSMSVFGGTASSNRASLQLWTSDVTLAGSGTITLANGNYTSGTRDPSISASTGSYTLTNEQGHTIQGSGTIGGMGFINKGTVISNQGHALTIQPSTTGFRNLGVLKAENGSSVVIEDNFKSYDSATQTLLEGSYIAKGGMDIKVGFVKNNAATIEFDGTYSGIRSTAIGASQYQPLLQNLEKNLGQLSIKNGKELRTYVPFENQGQMNVGTSSIFTVQNGISGPIQNYTQLAGSTILDGGTINAALLSIQGGSLSGNGTINAPVTIGAGVTVAPGSSPGTMTINGNYTQAGGILEIELGGKGAGEYDVLSIDGTADLAGTLKLLLYGSSYTPTEGDSFDVLFAKAITGGFTIDGSGTGWNWNVAYLDLNSSIIGADTVRLTAAPVPVPPSVWLLGSGLVGLIGLRRRFKHYLKK